DYLRHGGWCLASLGDLLPLFDVRVVRLSVRVSRVDSSLCEGSGTIFLILRLATRIASPALGVLARAPCFGDNSADLLGRQFVEPPLGDQSGFNEFQSAERIAYPSLGLTIRRLNPPEEFCNGLCGVRMLRPRERSIAVGGRERRRIAKVRPVGALI